MVDVTSSNLFQNTYKDGRINQNVLGKLSRFHLPGIPADPSSGAAQRTFVAGEKMWVTNIQVTGTGITMQLYTDAYNDIRYGATLTFPFKGSGIPIDQQAEKVVAEVFDVQPSDDSSAKGQQEQAPAAGQQQQAPAGGQAQQADAAPAAIPPPPPPADEPPPAPTTIALGQTKDVVVANLGQRTENRQGRSQRDLFLQRSQGDIRQRQGHRRSVALNFRDYILGGLAMSNEGENVMNRIRFASRYLMGMLAVLLLGWCVTSAQQKKSSTPAPSKSSSAPPKSSSGSASHASSAAGHGPSTAGGSHGPSTAGGSHGPSTAGGSHGPTTAGGSDRPTTAGGSHGPTTAGGSHGPTTSGHGAATGGSNAGHPGAGNKPNTVGGHDPTAKGGSARTVRRTGPEKGVRSQKGSHTARDAHGNEVRTRANGRPADVHVANRGMDIHHGLDGSRRVSA